VSIDLRRLEVMNRCETEQDMALQQRILIIKASV